MFSFFVIFPGSPRQKKEHQTTNQQPTEPTILKQQILDIENLSKSYGKLEALKELDLSVERGQVFGLLGPNGSGKTTTLGIILGALHPNRGDFRWFGERLTEKSLKRIGAILEHPNFYPYLNAVDNLKIVARIRNSDVSDIDRVLRLTNLYDRRLHRYQTYSYGMKQRLAIAGALLGNPEVLILDEPTNGLDPLGIAEIRELIAGVAAEGTTIIMASHLLDEVQKICSHVAVLKQGRKLFAGSVDDVLNNTETILVGAESMEALEAALIEYPDYQSHKLSSGFVEMKSNGVARPAELNRFLFEKGIVSTHLSIRKKSLENYFLEITASNGGTNQAS